MITLKVYKTDDGATHKSYEVAMKHLENTYADLLTLTSHQLVRIDKYVDMCAFVDGNLHVFEELIRIKKEMDAAAKGVEDEADE